VLHPNVLSAAGIENKVGLAMGCGVERIAMFKYGINDVRDFYSNNFNSMKGYKK
jgi:phenylalanyl-tRNA synthetase alpha chain